MSPAPAHHGALKGGARGRTARAIAIDLNCVGSAGSWALGDLSLHASPGGSEAPYAFGPFYLYAETLANLVAKTYVCELLQKVQTCVRQNTGEEPAAKRHKTDVEETTDTTEKQTPYNTRVVEHGTEEWMRAMGSVGLQQTR